MVKNLERKEPKEHQVKKKPKQEKNKRKEVVKTAGKETLQWLHWWMPE